jgi:ribokinase
MTTATTVVVLGSANIDTVYAVEALPREGETIHASGTATHAGGKGLNQAVAAARAGARVRFIGAIGPDGGILRGVLRSAGVEDSARVVDEPSGSALITVDAAGRNTIVLDAGANGTLRALTDVERDAVAAADALLLQFEVPEEALLQAARAAAASGTTVVLNAAPMRAASAELLGLVDVLIVNEHEAAQADALWTGDAGTAEPLAARFPVVIVTLGEAGADVSGAAAAPSHHTAIASAVVDTTAAGDTFVGAFTARTADGAGTEDAVRYAVAAAALAVRKHGAAESIPTDAETRALLTASG